MMNMMNVLNKQIFVENGSARMKHTQQMSRYQIRNNARANKQGNAMLSEKQGEAVRIRDELGAWDNTTKMQNMHTNNSSNGI